MGDVIANVTQTTTNGYLSIAKVNIASQYDIILIQLTELDVNSAVYRILASNDDVTYQTIREATALAQNTSAVPETLTDPWKYVDVQIIDGAGHASVKCVITGS
jgi:hypothetical protein